MIFFGVDFLFLFLIYRGYIGVEDEDEMRPIIKGHMQFRPISQKPMRIY